MRALVGAKNTFRVTRTPFVTSFALFFPKAAKLKGDFYETAKRRSPAPPKPEPGTRFAGLPEAPSHSFRKSKSQNES